MFLWHKIASIVSWTLNAPLCYQASHLGAKKVPIGDPLRQYHKFFPPNQKKLSEVYKLFDIQHPPRNDSTGLLLNPFEIYDEIIQEETDELDQRQTCGPDK